MSDVPNTQVNEFGTVKQDLGLPDANLHQQGAEPTLAEILAAIQGKQTVQPAAVPSADISSTPAADVVKDALGTPAKDEINTGNKALDVAVSSFIRSTGASDEDLQRATANALAYNDPALIDDAFLKERFKDRWEEAKQIAEAVLEQTGVERQKLVDSVYAVAGDKAGWDASLAVYKQHAAPGLQKAIQMMFDSNDAASIKEAAALVVDFAKGSGVLPAAGGRVVAAAGVVDAGGLSAAELKAAMNKLNPSSRTYATDYAKLIELRRVGRDLGK
ncbi:MAG: hypothetical protein [Caudoviricetes sp.]|nr:MAG: hypothetical protein [Caudoviricetes sp.]